MKRLRIGGIFFSIGIVLYATHGWGGNASLTNGWNLISLPLEPNDPSVSNVFASIASQYKSVWGYTNNSWTMYNPDNPIFSDLTEIRAGSGYWVEMKQAALLSYNGSNSTTAISLVPGWNLVGYTCSNNMNVELAVANILSSIESIWSFENSAWKMYDPANPIFSDLTAMEPGRGYWIKAKTVATWNPSCTVQTSTIQLPKTGQTTSYMTGDDGALQKGVAWPIPRFTSNGDGTVTDNLTGLIWLQDSNCTDTVAGVSKTSGYMFWPDALTWSNGLAPGVCNLTDGSKAGDWRLPNINELESLVDVNSFSPALTIGHPFIGVQQLLGYWTSTTYAADTKNALYVNMGVGLASKNLRSSYYYVWPVRGGQ